MKARYVPDLSKQMAQCEANYLRLMKLMPDLDECDARRFQLSWPDHQVRLSLIVEERFKYTTSVLVSQQHDHDSPWLEAPELVVRLYHDARAAEVICQRRRKQLAGVYAYPNKLMCHPDEKLQLNQYLGEWLGHCLKQGHLIEPVFVNA
ncbi:MAG: DUF1249 domain-containing protein [Pontibacterium sp.]